MNCFKTSGDQVVRAALVGVLILLFAVGCGCEGPERKVYRGGTTHFPLLDGRVMKYEERTEDGAREFTMRFRYLGGRVIKTYEAVYKGLDLETVRFISDGQTVTYVTATPRTKADELPEFRELWLDENARHGDVWDDYDTGTQTVFAGYETVNVIAGQFPDCYKTVTTGHPAFADTLKLWRQSGRISQREYERQISEGAKTLVRWFAADVGLVKEQIIGSGPFRELMEVVQPGTGLVDTLSVVTPNPNADQE